MLTDLRVFWHVLMPKRLALLRAARGLPRSPFRNGTFLLLGGGCVYGIERLSAWFLQKCMEVELVGPLIPRKLLSLLLMVVLAVLGLSATISAFSTIFLSDDLDPLVASPIPRGPLFYARALEAAVHSSWMVFFFTMPVLFAYGRVYSAPPAYYGWMAFVLVVLITLPATAGIILATVLTRLFSARRSRDLMTILVVVGFVALYLIIRALRPERMLEEDSFGSMMEFLGMFRTPESPYMPSFWAAEVLYASLRRVPVPHLQLFCLVTCAGALVAIAGWTGSLLFPAAFSRAQQGRSRAVGTTPPLRGRLLGRWLDAPAALAGKGWVFLAKEARAFFRDPNQWLQLLLLAALAAVYVLNFYYLKAARFSWYVLYTVNHVLLGLVLAGIAVRFVFPSVSMEGRAWWVIGTSPIWMGEFLHAKLLVHLVPTCTLAALLSAVSCAMIGVPIFFGALSVGVMLLVGWGISCLAIGIGAIWPRFKVENPAKIPTGTGGISYMILSLGYVMLMLLASVYPGMVFAQWPKRLENPIPHPGWFWGSIAFMAVLQVAATWLPMYLGKRRLERFEW